MNKIKLADPSIRKIAKGQMYFTAILTLLYELLHLTPLKRVYQNLVSKATREKKRVGDIPVLEYCVGSPKGKPLVFMTHGYGSFKERMANFAMRLADKGYFVVAPDALAHGERNEPGRYSILQIVERSVADIDFLIEYYKANSDVDAERFSIVGRSMGGFVAYDYLVNGKYTPRAIAPTISSPDDQFYRDVESSIMEQTIAKFHDENPTIVIDRTTKTLDDLKLVLKMAVESGTGPDIMQVNQGEADMGVFVKAGLLVDLTATAKVKKWNSIFSDSALKLMGYKGKTYGVSSTAEIVGFFYNKGIFEKLGLKIPQTFSELQATLDKVKKAGYTPINFGNLDGWTGIHEWSGIQHVLTTRNELDDMMSGTKGTFWMASANIKAAETLQAWVKAGYFSKNFAAISP